MKSISILGATGSIGTSTLDLLSHHRDRYRVEAVTAQSNAEQLAAIARAHGARFAAIADPVQEPVLREALAGTGIECGSGEGALIEAAQRPCDLLVSAITGIAGLAPTLAAVEQGRVIALANKETLVAAGQLVTQTANARGATLLPLDSEHNAVFQALSGSALADVEMIHITGSGGPFRQWTRAQMDSARISDALRHPNFQMGRKITIDSATLMNKGLELIEAHHLFHLPASQIEVVIHPQQAIHGMVTFKDGSSVAQIGAADMRIPIASCLAWPNRIAGPSRRLRLVELGQMTFEAPDLQRFPALALAIEGLEAGGCATTVLNAANESAVAAFLDGRIRFTAIAEIVGRVLERQGAGPAPATLVEIYSVDHDARKLARELAVHSAFAA